MGKKKATRPLINLKENLLEVDASFKNGLVTFSKSLTLKEVSNLINKSTRDLIRLLKKEKIVDIPFISEDYSLSVDQL
ncbi:MAG: hypothetical protein HRS57_01215, partial [Mycoplasmataceae bacterium]|nr:hypothetical protein [Mycoplasmataceae bacterium]